MNKKILPIVLVLVLVVLGGGVFAFTRLRGTQNQPEQTATKKKVTAPVNVIAVDQRPYVQIIPKADGHNLTLRVVNLKKAATSMEYEIEYQTGTLLQGFSGVLDVTKLPVEDTKLLGSCSAGGACTYHEDVQGGNIHATYLGGEEVYALKSDWRYFDNKAKSTEFSSKDAKFKISSTDLKNQRYLTVFNTPGYPETLPGTLVSELYALSGSSALSGTAQITIRANEEGNLKLIGWNGQSWKEFDTTVDAKEASAKVDLMELYAVIK